MIEGVTCPICGSDNVWFKLICTSLISGVYFDRDKYQCVECKNIFPVKQKENKGVDNMNITIDQIIETLKDESKRKKIEEIISGDKPKEFEEDIFIRSNYYISDVATVVRDNEKEYSLNSTHCNHFENEKEAIMIAKKQDAEKKLYHIAKHLNKGWTPDWKRREKKFSIFYNYFNNCYAMEYDCTSKRSLVYFKSEEMLPDIIRLMGEQSLKDYFMLEG